MGPRHFFLLRINPNPNFDRHFSYITTAKSLPPRLCVVQSPLVQPARTTSPLSVTATADTSSFSMVPPCVEQRARQGVESRMPRFVVSTDK